MSSGENNQISNAAVVIDINGGYTTANILADNQINNALTA